MADLGAPGLRAVEKEGGVEGVEGSLSRFLVGQLNYLGCGERRAKTIRCKLLQWTKELMK